MTLTGIGSINASSPSDDGGASHDANSSSPGRTGTDRRANRSSQTQVFMNPIS